MNKTILLTGGTDGIGFETAKILVSQGHTLLLHGRNEAKLASAKEALAQINADAVVETCCADLSDLTTLSGLVKAVKANHSSLDVLINNAGVFKVPQAQAATGFDVRFLVNTLAPYVLTKSLMPLFSPTARVVNLSSAAQAPVELAAFQGQKMLSDSAAYAQSKLALTMWTFELAKTLSGSQPALIAVNPASFLGSKMVKEAYGSQGKDLGIGADVLVRAALSDEFAGHSGEYFDNDCGQWSSPHPDALDTSKNVALIAAMDEILSKLNISTQ